MPSSFPEFLIHGLHLLYLSVARRFLGCQDGLEDFHPTMDIRNRLLPILHTIQEVSHLSPIHVIQIIISRLLENLPHSFLCLIETNLTVVEVPFQRSLFSKKLIVPLIASLRIVEMNFTDSTAAESQNHLGGI